MNKVKTKFKRVIAIVVAIVTTITMMPSGVQTVYASAEHSYSYTTAQTENGGTTLTATCVNCGAAYTYQLDVPEVTYGEAFSPSLTVNVSAPNAEDVISVAAELNYGSAVLTEENLTAVEGGYTWSSTLTEGLSAVTYSSADYASSTTAPVNAGTYTAALVIRGELSVTAAAVIDAKNTDDLTAEASGTYVYNQEEQNLVLIVKDGETVLTEGTDYALSGTLTATDVNSEGYSVTVAGIGNYTGSKTVTWLITPFDISSESAKLAYTASHKTYDGTEQKTDISNVTVQMGEESVILKENTDYTVDCTGVTDAGTVEKVSITGTGNYTGVYTVSEGDSASYVNVKDLASADISAVLVGDTKYYNAVAQTQEVKVTDAGRQDEGGAELVLDKDYTVAGNIQTNAGTYTLTITGKGNYTGTIEKTWKIEKADVAHGLTTEVKLSDYAERGVLSTPVTTITFVYTDEDKDGDAVDRSVIWTFTGEILTKVTVDGTDYTTIEAAAEVCPAAKAKFAVSYLYKGRTARNHGYAEFNLDTTSSAQPRGAGDYTVIANITTTDNYYTGSDSDTFHVKGDTAAIVTTSAAEYTYTGKPVEAGLDYTAAYITELSMYSFNGVNYWQYDNSSYIPAARSEGWYLIDKKSVGDVTYYYQKLTDSDNNTWSDPTTTAPTHVGTYRVFATFSGSDEYNATAYYNAETNKVEGATVNACKYTEFKIVPVKVKSSDITVAFAGTTSSTTIYNFGVQKPVVTIKGVTVNKDETELLTLTDSELVWSDSNSTDAGTYTVAVKATGNSDYVLDPSDSKYSSADGRFEYWNYYISKRDLSTSTITLKSTDFTYNGCEQTAEIASVQFLVNGSAIGTVSSDYYTVSGNTQTNAGTYTITVTAKADTTDPKFTNNFTGYKTIDFTIDPEDLAKAEVVLEYGYWESSSWQDQRLTYTYSDTAKQFAVTGTNLSSGRTWFLYRGYQIWPSIDLYYTNANSDKIYVERGNYTYAGDVSAIYGGTYKMTLTGKSNFTGEYTLVWNVGSETTNAVTEVEGWTYGEKPYKIVTRVTDAKSKEIAADRDSSGNVIAAGSGTESGTIVYTLQYASSGYTILDKVSLKELMSFLENPNDAWAGTYKLTTYFYRKDTAYADATPVVNEFTIARKNLNDSDITVKMVSSIPYSLVSASNGLSMWSWYYQGNIVITDDRYGDENSILSSNQVRYFEFAQSVVVEQPGVYTLEIDGYENYTGSVTLGYVVMDDEQTAQAGTDKNGYPTYTYVYDGTAHAFGTGNDEIVKVLYDGEKEAPKNVGKYEVTYTMTTTGKNETTGENEERTYNGIAYIVIEKRPVSISINDIDTFPVTADTITYGDIRTGENEYRGDELLTYTVDPNPDETPEEDELYGVVEGETLELTREYEAIEDEENAGFEDAGSYAISVKEDSAVNANYDITVSKPGTFTIAKKYIKAAALAADMVSELTYNGKEQTPVISDSETAKAVTIKTADVQYKIDGVVYHLEEKTLSLIQGTDYENVTAAQTAAGSYTVSIQACADSKNYTGNAKFAKKMVIAPLDLADTTVTVPIAEYTYDTEAQEPVVTVTDKDGNVIPSSDYEVSYVNNIESGNATATAAQASANIVEGSSQKTTFRIVAVNITEYVGITIWVNGTEIAKDASAGTYAYTGKAIEPEVEVQLNGEVVPASNYKVVYSNNVREGTASLTVNGVGSLSGSQTRAFNVSKSSNVLDGVAIELAQTTYTYDGTEKTPEVISVTLTDGTVLDAADYEVTYSNNVNAGTATVTVSGKNGMNTKGSESTTFTIEKADPGLTLPATSDYTYQVTTVSYVAVSDSTNPVKYTYCKSGTDKVVAVNEEGTNWPSEYGTYNVTVYVEEADNYKAAAKTTTINIVRVNITEHSGIEVEVAGTEYAYTGAEIKPEVTVLLNGIEVPASNYDVVYTDNVRQGTAAITVNGKENLFGVQTRSFEITTADDVLTGATVELAQTTYTYDGTAKTPAVTKVTLADGTVLDAKDYEAAYSENVNAGTATVTVTGKTNTTDSATATFTIEKADPVLALSNLTNYTYKVTPISYFATSKSTGAITYTYCKSGTDNVVTVDAEGSNWPSDYGTYNVTVSVAEDDNYLADSKDTTINIVRVNITEHSGVEVKVEYAEHAYTGAELEPEVTVLLNGVEVPAFNYSVVYSDNVRQGTASIIVNGQENLFGVQTSSFEITTADDVLTGATVELAQTTYTYDGTAKKPVVTKVTLADGTVLDAKDYEVAYSDNVKAGTGTVTVTGKTNTKDSATAAFTIEKADPILVLPSISNYTYKASPISYTASARSEGEITYTYRKSGSNKTVTVDAEGSNWPSDYGTYNVTVSVAEDDNYAADSKETTISIIKKNITLDDNVTLEIGEYNAEFNEDQSARTPSVTLTITVDGETNVVDPVNYKVSYSENTFAGTATVTVTAVDARNLEGSISGEFFINGLVSNLDQVDGWYYLEDGEVDTTYTGFAKNAYSDWYVENGEVTFAVNSVLQDEDGVLGTAGDWYYVESSEVKYVDTLASNDYGWWKITDGKADFSYTGFASNEIGDWYIQNGYLSFAAEGLFQDETGVLGTAGDWYYVQNSEVQYVDTLACNEVGWWKVTDGKVDFTYTGFASNEVGDWYVQNGSLTFDVEGLIMDETGAIGNAGDWYYVWCSQVQRVDTLACNSVGWWKVTNGKVEFGFNGLASNEAGTWYLADGLVDFSYNSSYYTYDGKAYTITSGKATVIE